MQLTQGGKTVYGATVGILMLESRFPRIPGDMGNALTWPFPVQYRIVRGASPDRIVRRDARELLDDFITAGRDLVDSGCDGITTNCGFLALLQHELCAALGVPVATSALLQVPMIRQMLPADKTVGILTINSATLSENHLRAAGVAPDTPIVGTDPDGEFSSRILDDHPQIDFAMCRREMLDAAQTLTNRHPGCGAIVLECTNMVPYAADIRLITGLPVFSIYTMVCWFQNALLPAGFDPALIDRR